MSEERREHDANENAYKREQRGVHSAKADWEFLRDTVTPPPFYHNEHAWSVMWSLIERRIAATRPAPKADGLDNTHTVEVPLAFYEWLAGIEKDVRVHDLTPHEQAGLVAALRDRDVVLEEAIQAAQDCEIVLPLGVGLADGAQRARRRIIKDLKALKERV